MDALYSSTLAELYLRQGHPQEALHILKTVRERDTSRRTEILTDLLSRVTIHKHELQRQPRRDL
jgi:hypothetical protein